MMVPCKMFLVEAKCCVSKHLTAVLILGYNVLFKTHHRWLWMIEGQGFVQQEQHFLSRVPHTFFSSHQWSHKELNLHTLDLCPIPLWWYGEPFPMTHLKCHALKDNPLFSSRSFSALSIVTSVTTVFELPLRALSTTLLFPSLKCLCQQNTVSWLIASVPYALYNISDFLSPLFLGFTQNSVTHLSLKTNEIPFCYAIAKQVYYKSSYKHAHSVENYDFCTGS
jgi:hypothetical protein